MTTATARKGLTLARAGREFWKHPSPWMIGTTLLVALVARVVVGDWQWTDALLPALMVATFPFYEWVIHVVILHWRPRNIGRLKIDPLLSRKHRAHHADPRNAALVFIPWKALLWILPFSLVFAGALAELTRPGLGLTYLTCYAGMGIVYEWCHYLVHSDYKPKTRPYRAIYRDHRLHHYKNEHYWFTVTTSGTADRVFGTYPNPADVSTSPTAKNLHGGSRDAMEPVPAAG